MPRLYHLSLAIAFFSYLLISCEKDSETIDPSPTQSECGNRCSLEPSPGNCYAAITKYYYDQTENECKPFTWGGCGGVVPFETLEEFENCRCH